MGCLLFGVAVIIAAAVGFGAFQGTVTVPSSVDAKTLALAAAWFLCLLGSLDNRKCGDSCECRKAH